MLQPAQKIQMPFVSGDFNFAASVADVTVGEIRGNCRIETGAGEVELGAVFGQSPEYDPPITNPQSLNPANNYAPVFNMLSGPPAPACG